MVLCFVGKVRFVNYESLITTMEESNIHFVCVCLWHFKVRFNYRGNNVDLVLCVLLGHQNSKIANSMKLVNFALFSSQYHVFELKNIRGNLIAPNSNRWSLSNKIAMSQEDNRKIISLFGQEKSIFLHPWMLKDLM